MTTSKVYRRRLKECNRKIRSSSAPVVNPALNEKSDASMVKEGPLIITRPKATYPTGDASTFNNNCAGVKRRATRRAVKNHFPPRQLLDVSVQVEESSQIEHPQTQERNLMDLDGINNSIDSSQIFSKLHQLQELISLMGVELASQTRDIAGMIQRIRNDQSCDHEIIQRTILPVLRNMESLGDLRVLPQLIQQNNQDHLKLFEWVSGMQSELVEQRSAIRTIGDQVQEGIQVLERDAASRQNERSSHVDASSQLAEAVFRLESRLNDISDMVEEVRNSQGATHISSMREDPPPSFNFFNLSMFKQMTWAEMYDQVPQAIIHNIPMHISSQFTFYLLERSRVVGNFAAFPAEIAPMIEKGAFEIYGDLTEVIRICEEYYQHGSKIQLLTDKQSLKWYRANVNTACEHAALKLQERMEFLKHNQQPNQIKDREVSARDEDYNSPMLESDLHPDTHTYEMTPVNDTQISGNEEYPVKDYQSVERSNVIQDSLASEEQGTGRRHLPRRAAQKRNNYFTNRYYCFSSSSEDEENEQQSESSDDDLYFEPRISGDESEDESSCEQSDYHTLDGETTSRGARASKIVDLEDDVVSVSDDGVLPFRPLEVDLSLNQDISLDFDPSSFFQEDNHTTSIADDSNPSVTTSDLQNTADNLGNFNELPGDLEDENENRYFNYDGKRPTVYMRNFGRPPYVRADIEGGNAYKLLQGVRKEFRIYHNINETIQEQNEPLPAKVISSVMDYIKQQIREVGSNQSTMYPLLPYFNQSLFPDRVKAFIGTRLPPLNDYKDKTCAALQKLADETSHEFKIAPMMACQFLGRIDPAWYNNYFTIRKGAPGVVSQWVLSFARLIVSHLKSLLETRADNPFINRIRSVDLFAIIANSTSLYSDYVVTPSTFKRNLGSFLGKFHKKIKSTPHPQKGVHALKEHQEWCAGEGTEILDALTYLLSFGSSAQEPGTYPIANVGKRDILIEDAQLRFVPNRKKKEQHVKTHAPQNLVKIDSNLLADLFHKNTSYACKIAASIFNMADGKEALMVARRSWKAFLDPKGNEVDRSIYIVSQQGYNLSHIKNAEIGQAVEKLVEYTRIIVDSVTWDSDHLCIIFNTELMAFIAFITFPEWRLAFFDEEILLHPTKNVGSSVSTLRLKSDDIEEDARLVDATTRTLIREGWNLKKLHHDIGKHSVEFASAKEAIRHAAMPKPSIVQQMHPSVALRTKHLTRCVRCHLLGHKKRACTARKIPSDCGACRIVGRPEGKTCPSYGQSDYRLCPVLNFISRMMVCVRREAELRAVNEGGMYYNVSEPNAVYLQAFAKEVPKGDQTHAGRDNERNGMEMDAEERRMDVIARDAANIMVADAVNPGRRGRRRGRRPKKNNPAIADCRNNVGSNPAEEDFPNEGNTNEHMKTSLSDRPLTIGWEDQ